jgi:BMFP domain-containing protein YqiC
MLAMIQVAHTIMIMPTARNVQETMNGVHKFTDLLQHVATSIQQGVEDVQEDDEVKAELKTMKTAVPLVSETVMQYMAHRLRAKVQFAAIKNKFV